LPRVRTASSSVNCIASLGDMAPASTPCIASRNLSEIEGGVFLNDLPPSTVLEIQTMHHCYKAVLLGGSEALLSGHPEFCPEPVQVAISGSTWGGSMLKLQFVGRGMHLEFRHPQYPMPIVTSPIQEIRDNVSLPGMEFDGRAHGAHS